MAATELATAYLSLVPSMRGAQGKIASELAGVDADGIGKGIGGRMGGGIAGTLKGLVGPALAGLAAIGFGGFIAEAGRASDATDKFKGTLNFAGLDMGAVDAATKSAKAYADETVYDLSDIQSTMATLAANGVKDYTGITTAAGNLNAVAGGNAETFKSVSRALGQSAGAGKLMTEDWNMLADAIPGASGELQKAMKEAGAFEGNFKKAMENGEITADEFQAAIVKLGDTPIASEAARSVTTFEGALGNLSATVNSGLMGGLDALKPAITGAINGVSDGIGAAFDFLGSAIPGIYDLIVKGDFTGAMSDAFGLEEDSPAVGFMLKTHDVLTDGIPGIVSILKDGDFTGAMSSAFGVEEDSPVVDMLFNIREGAIAAFGGVKDALGPLVPDLLALWSAASPLNTIFMALQPSIGPLVDMLFGLASSVGGSLMAALTGVLPAIQSLQSVMVTLFMDVLAVALPLIAQLVTTLGGTLASLIPILVPIIVQVASLAASLVSQLAPVFMSLVSAVLPMVISTLTAVLGAIGPVVQIVAGLLIPIIQALLPVVVTVFSVVASVVQSAMQIVQGIIQVVTGIISGNWAQVFQGLGNIASGAFSLIVGIIQGALSIVGSIVMGGLQFVGQVFINTFNGVTSFLGGVWGNITSGVSGMIGQVTGFFGGLIGRITGAIGNAGGALLQTGKDIVQGLINGIGSMMGAIGRAVLSIVPEAIRGPFEDLMGIHSPSRIAIWWGHMIGGGAVIGLKDMYGPIADAAGGLFPDLGVPGFASSSALNAYSAYATPGNTAGSGATIHQYIQPSEKMSEENLANVAARKITGVLV